MNIKNLIFLALACLFSYQSKAMDGFLPAFKQGGLIAVNKAGFGPSFGPYISLYREFKPAASIAHQAEASIAHQAAAAAKATSSASSGVEAYGKVAPETPKEMCCHNSDAGKMVAKLMMEAMAAKKPSTPVMIEQGAVIPAEPSFEDMIDQTYGVAKRPSQYDNSATFKVGGKLLVIEGGSSVNIIKFGSSRSGRLLSDAVEFNVSLGIDIKQFVAAVVTKDKKVYLKTFDSVNGSQYFATGIVLE